jgi:ATP-dependent DNA helicase RecG
MPTADRGGGHDPRVPVTAFASARELTPGQLAAAPVRYPRPTWLGTALRLTGQRAQQAAESLGLRTVGELLEHLPHDRREARCIAELTPGESATVVVEVKSIAARSTRSRGLSRVEALVGDESGRMRVSFFRQPWLLERYPPGTRLLLHVRVDTRGRASVQTHAPSGDPLGGAGVVAHYPATQGLSSTQILALVSAHSAAFDEVLEPLPSSIRARERLLDRGAALRVVHFPRGEGDAEAGRRRLAFEELLLSQLELGRRRRGRSRGEPAPRIDGPATLTARWLAALPFEPTAEQAQAIATIDADLARAQPMQRLLMGEVGSGKTVVALYAMLRAVEHDLQAALMAPTETLAEQHFATLQRLMGSEPIRAGLLTGSTPARRRAELLARLGRGELSLLVGTHALIEDDVRFAALGVVVVDEQHRFGVAQRVALHGKGAGRSPHVLHMTATPIPRTLALAHYGDLDFTLLRELPAGRRPISTHLCSSDAERERAYQRIREELRAGRQAFVVCPLVEESEVLAARAATAEFERLRSGPFADFRVVLMHGQLRGARKAQAMQAFASGAADVLVATSVVEVGIDVPNATVMLVENAERFGISQLHQLRGRIGRGAHQSLCLLFGRRDSERLRALARESDGFALAEVDLRLRGEGELIGVRQSGAAELRFAELPRDAELLERARLAARGILDRDPELEEPEHALLAVALRGRFGAEASARLAA